MTRPSIVLATRELYPFGPGGIAPITAAIARALAPVADLTIVTSSAFADAYAELDEPYGAGVEVVFAQEPPWDAGIAGYQSAVQAWSDALYRAIRERFPDRGPDLIEFPDYLAEGFVTVQAKRTGEPALRDTRIAVRVHTSAEMCAVLDGTLDSRLESRIVLEFERYCLRHADVLLYSGGDVMGTYRRFYHNEALAPTMRLPEAFHLEFDPAPAAAREDETTVRLLYLGRLERRKGVQNLVRALRGIGYRNWSLTLIGGDTDTAPLQTSMRMWLEAAIGDDPRFRFHDPVPRREVGKLISGHDVVVVPSIWECWPNTAREAFFHDRPVLATPVGGLREMVEHGVSGWLTDDGSVEALASRLEELFESPEQVAALVDSGGPRAALERLNRLDETRAGYLRLASGDRARDPARPRTGAPLVSVVVPYYRMSSHVEATIASVRAQTWPEVEVVVVNDGSFGADDEVVYRLATSPDVRLVAQANRGLGAARNLGVASARGRYVLPLDADNLLEPTYVERCLAALESNPDLAFVTTWSRYIDELGNPLPLPDNGYTPLGNWTGLVDGDNVAGDGTALIRRSVFDLGHWYDTELTSFEDWFFYRVLHHEGVFGDVVPERLLRYRVRTDSMLRTIGLSNVGKIHDEMRARLIERGVEWTPRNA